MQARKQVQELQKRRKSSKKDKKKDIEKKRLKEEVVPHKLKISNVFAAAGGDQANKMSGFGEASKSNSGNVSSNRGESNSSKEEADGADQLDAEIQKGDIKMRAVLNSAYLSVSDSGDDNNIEERKEPAPSLTN